MIVFRGSRILKICSLYVSAFLATSSSVSCLRVSDFPRRIANHAGKIADQKNDLMSEILELFHFLDQHCVTQMEVRRGRIEPSFDSQGSAFFELRGELLFRQNLHGAALNERELLSQIRHDQSFASQPTRKRRISRALPVLIVEFNDNSLERDVFSCHFELTRQLGRKPLDYVFPFHTDHGIQRATHAEIGDIRGAAGRIRSSAVCT